MVSLSVRILASCETIRFMEISRMSSERPSALASMYRVAANIGKVEMIAEPRSRWSSSMIDSIGTISYKRTIQKSVRASREWEDEGMLTFSTSCARKVKHALPSTP